MIAAPMQPGEAEVRIPIGRISLEGDLVVPANARGIVLFAHGSGSSRRSSRNRFVAQELQQAGLATLLFDLLTREEERVDEKTRHLRFDISLLSSRLSGATTWVSQLDATRHLRIGYFGASTGGGAALSAAASRPDLVGAVVSRGGRPDLAGPALELVRAPTLLVVGGEDHVVITLNQQALNRLRCEKALAIVPGATHLFEEPGALEQVSRMAADWFSRYLGEVPEGVL